MIFANSLIHQIVAGRVTMTRVAVVEPELTRRTKRINGQARPYGPEYWTQPFEPNLGDRISVQPPELREVKRRGKTHMRTCAGEAEAHVIVTEVRQEALGAIPFPDALRQGFKTTAAFKAAWVRSHDKAWLKRLVACAGCHCPDHGGLEGCSYCHGTDRIPHEDLLMDKDLVARFEKRHAHRLVWAIAFRLDREDRPLFLTPAARGARDGDEHGYTHNPAKALRDAGEAVDPALIDQAWFGRAAEKHAAAGDRKARARRATRGLRAA